jgi:hypothetical protein
VAIQHSQADEMNLRFSLRELLAVVLVVAVLLGVLRWSLAAWQAALGDSTGMFAAGGVVLGAVALATYGISQRG